MRDLSEESHEHNFSIFGFRVFASKKVRCPRQGSFQNRLRLETRRPFGDQTSGARTVFVVGVVISSSSLAVVYVVFLLFCDGDCLLLDDFHFCRAFLFSTFYKYEFTHTLSLSLSLFWDDIGNVTTVERGKRPWCTTTGTLSATVAWRSRGRN